MKKYKVILLIAFIIICLNGAAYADWHIQFDSEADRVLHLGGDMLRGNFATQGQCHNYWRSRPNFEQNHSRCVGYDRKSNTSSYGSGGYSGYSGGGRPNSSQQQMMQGLFSSFMQGFMNGLAQQNNYNAQQQKREEEEKRKKEWQQKVNKQIDEMKNEYAKLKEQEFNESKDKLAKDLRDILNRGNKGGTANQEVNHKIKAIKDLNCAAYWGLQAAGAALNNNDKDASTYSDFSNAASSGNMVSGCPDKNMNIPEPSNPQRVDFQMDFYGYLNDEVNKKIETIQNFKTEIKKADEKVAEDTKKVEKIKANSNSAKNDKEKKEFDDLLEQANQELAKSIELRDKAKTEFDNQKKEVDALNEIYKIMSENKQGQGEK